MEERTDPQDENVGLSPADSQEQLPTEIKVPATPEGMTEENVDLSPAEPQERLPARVKEPAAPEGITDEELQELKKRSADLVKQLEGASGSKEMEYIDTITSVGIKAQRNAGTELDLLRTRVGDMISGGGPGAQIPKELADLRLTLNQINPHEMKDIGFVRRAFSKLPIIGKPALKVLERIAIRYEPVCKQVAVIETRLREGRTMLTKDNVELRKLYEQVEAQEKPIQKNAYLGELLMQQLDEVLKHTDDPAKTERVQNALHDVSMRVQDMYTAQEVYTQFFVSIEMTRQNNTRLGQAVERTLTLAANVVLVGLAIQSALSRQKRVLQATQRTREFLGELLVANAAAIKQHTAEIGDVYNNPVIAIDKITQAHNELMEAMDMADRLKQEGIASARENIGRLKELTAGLQERSKGLRELPAAGPQSIEA